MPWKIIEHYSLRITSGLIIIASILVLFFFDTSLSVRAQDTTNLEAEVQAIQGRINEINSSLEDVSQLKDSFTAEVARVEGEIAETDQLIADTNTAIDGLEGEIAQNNIDIANLEEDISALTKQIQKNNHVSPLQNLLSSRDVGEAIGKMFTLSNTQADLDEKRAQLEDLNVEKEANLETQQTLKEQLETTSETLAGKKASLDSLIQTYRGRESEYARQIAELKAQESSTQNQIQALEEQERIAREEQSRRESVQGSNPGGGNNPPSAPGSCFFEDGSNPGIPAGFFMNPVSGSAYAITDTFGCPTPQSWQWRAGHDGMDLASRPVGSKPPIKAAAAGVVIQKSNSGGYGNWVMVKHTLPNSFNVYTMYAHLNSPSPIGVGVPVAKGQVIGTMGSTGWSTGVHLHFMIQPTPTIGCRLNGGAKCYNPARFISF
jgi:murein DD-endopeptidase MepM/ murein hydrolase activator NlpD